jgi:hypothetical protein
MITIDLHTATLASVIERPSLLARLLLRRRESERFAVALPSINGGRTWHWDADGRRVPPRIEAALELALALADRRRVDDEWRRIWRSMSPP